MTGRGRRGPPWPEPLFADHEKPLVLPSLAPPAALSAVSVSVMREIFEVLRGYASAVVLGVFAIVFLVLGSPAKAAVAGAGFALVGAAITRGIDLARERRAEAAEAEAGRLRDLDETRRLLYMLLLKRPDEPRDPDLSGTLINALVHHGLAVGWTEAMAHITAFENYMDDDAVRWLQGQIDRITAELGS
jgi:hypothetical protein